jgi:membrane protein YdbS with pleckstrin-like domain
VNALHPRVRIVWRLSALLAVLVLSAGVGALEILVLSPRDVTGFYPGVVTGSVAALGLILALAWPGLHFRHWRWDVGPDRVTIQKGVIWRSRSLIPRVRIQHVDTQTSPLQRWLGLSSLIIYTAGTRGADAEIPGLAVEDAERLREELARLDELDETA